MKAEVTIKNNFYLYLHLNEDFKKAYNDLMNKSSLFIEFENDIAFMSEFQNEFSKTNTTPNVHKYLRLIYTEKQILSTIYKSHGIDSRGEYTPLESELDKRKNQLYKLINDSKEPKECYTHNIKETNIYKQFKVIEEILNRFKEMKGFDTSVDSLVKQAEEFGKGLISEIQNINYEPIRNRIIEVIIKDKENFNSYLNGYNNRNFKAQEFNDNYAKAKMYLNNYLKIYLETQVQTIKENNQFNTIEKKPTMKENHLFKIGLKLALGELDEDLIIKGGNISVNTDLSFRKLAKKYMLDEVYLKCTIGNYTVSNQNKNLRNNPEIIKKVLTHLKSIGKEPKEWFLNEFETIVL
ncbi:hypothetical protein [Myroides odoratimimus]|uniref:hypothetical protein n=1 Tax=Myroides odoratimimus TaxID=76832 RepID=UPI0025778A34|nr:hypothetical protein [Myroides odoratimimus]MDM1060844.1 hypothetical protein [Myroides odoratimimus]